MMVNACRSEPGTATSRNTACSFVSAMKTNNNPAENRNERLPVEELGPDDPRRDPRSGEGISPQQPETMPRAEDDEETHRRSPEFHDRAS